MCCCASTWKAIYVPLPLWRLHIQVQLRFTGSFEAPTAAAPAPALLQALLLGAGTLAASCRGGLLLLAFFFASSKITQVPRDAGVLYVGAAARQRHVG